MNDTAFKYYTTIDHYTFILNTICYNINMTLCYTCGCNKLHEAKGLCKNHYYLEWQKKNKEKANAESSNIDI
jgi:hypothetical protein